MRNLIATLAIVLVACGGGDKYDSLDAAIAGEQCNVEIHHGEAKMFATDEVHCSDGTIISWHASETDRNAYADVLEGMWSVVPDEQGANYNIYR